MCRKRFRSLLHTLLYQPLVYLLPDKPTVPIIIDHPIPNVRDRGGINPRALGIAGRCPTGLIIRHGPVVEIIAENGNIMACSKLILPIGQVVIIQGHNDRLEAGINITLDIVLKGRLAQATHAIGTVEVAKVLWPDPSQFSTSLTSLSAA